MKESLRTIVERLAFDLGDEELEKLKALLLRWSIWSEKETAGLAEKVKALDHAQRDLLGNALLSLLRVGIPYSQPVMRSVSMLKKQGVVDSLPEEARPFLNRGYKPCDLILLGGAGTTSHGGQFRFVPAYGYQEVLKSKSFEYSDLISPFDGKPIGKLEAVDPQWEDVREVQLKQGKKPGQLPPQIEWLKPETMPPPGTKMEIVLEYDPSGMPGLIPAGLNGTGQISPLGKVVLTAEEILRPPGDWETTVRFAVEEKVSEFVPIATSSRLVDFTKALSPKSRTNRSDRLPLAVSAAEVRTKYWKNPWWFVPRTLAVNELDYKNPILRRLWELIELELVHRLGFNPRTPPEKSRIQLAAVKKEEQQKNSSDYIKSKYQRATDSVAEKLKRLARHEQGTDSSSHCGKLGKGFQSLDPDDPDAADEAFVDRQVSMGPGRRYRAKRRDNKLKKSFE